MGIVSYFKDFQHWRRNVKPLQGAPVVINGNMQQTILRHVGRCVRLLRAMPNTEGKQLEHLQEEFQRRKTFLAALGVALPTEQSEIEALFSRLSSEESNNG